MCRVGLLRLWASCPHPALRATLRASFARIDPTKKGRDEKRDLSFSHMEIF
jgi:hypothetical protein